MQYKFITTRNYTRIYEAIQYLKNLPEKVPKMGIAYGLYGIGKTLSLNKIAEDEQAVLLECSPTWTQSTFLKAMCLELEEEPTGTSTTKLEKIVRSLSYSKKVIIIDEVDRILGSDKKAILDAIRYIHDQTETVVMVVGMGNALAKLKKDGAFYSRLTQRIKLQGTCEEDIRSFCSNSEITIKENLVKYFADKHPNLRFVKVFIENLERYCEINDIDEADLKIFKESGAEDLDGKETL